MFILGNLLAALASVIGLVLNLYMWIIIARAVISWVNPDPNNPIVRFLYSITDPVLLAIRRRLPLSFGGRLFAYSDNSGHHIFAEIPGRFTS